MILRSEEFWDDAEHGKIMEHMYFCYDCAKDIKNTFEKNSGKIRNDP